MQHTIMRNVHAAWEWVMRVPDKLPVFRAKRADGETAKKTLASATPPAVPPKT